MTSPEPLDPPEPPVPLEPPVPPDTPPPASEPTVYCRSSQVAYSLPAQLAADRGHLIAAEAGRLAAEAGVGALYLTHISGRYDPAEIAAEAGRYFDNVLVASDFDRVSVTTASRRHPS